MSRPAGKAPRALNTTDLVLGSFSNVPPNETLNHAIRYLGTWSGFDKAMMVTQYGSKLVVAFLSLQHVLRVRLAGAKTFHAEHGGSSVAKRITRLGGLISDARTLYRIWGILPMIQWMISIERNPPPTRLLHNIERIQGWSMLLYCPLEAICYLASHSIIPVSAHAQGRMMLLSVRAWAVYVMLQLLHLVEDNRLLRLRARALERSRGHPTPARTPSTEKNVQLGDEQEQTRQLWKELDARKEAILNQLWVNLGYLPLTLHWSVPGGLISDAWVGLFGTVAASAGLKAGWRATAK
ncbi:hypothetical protein IE81DRAFT_325423 [Ceraceosorus guamensis]|uniref:Peroxisomal biogenesis factor 11 n=1 Tax=Ceraceosorus guamensis TaxID=1522189 RepID=A0A316VT59_9BASI|nr:hypothetical protein IE81DRAFT_325423 [Ceraceosorus guamensis]PWN40560.1 hypothetical protein IE81DRAFT_325423 [Ceraceosorus guamensis]